MASVQPLTPLQCYIRHNADWASSQERELVVDAAMQTPQSPSLILGSGSFGKVYPLDTCGKPLVVKRVDVTDTSTAANAGKEAVLLAALTATQAGITPALQAVATDGDNAMLLVMDRAPLTLDQCLKKAGPAFDHQETAVIFTTALALVHGLHTLGLTHNDLKSKNLVLLGSPGAYLPQLIDLDAATLVPMAGAEGKSAGGVGQGVNHTTVYTSPERLASGQCTPQSDMWALGIILYELLEGRRRFPFNWLGKPQASKDTMQRILNYRKTNTVRLPACVEAGPFAALLHGLLHPDPALRWTARECASYPNLPEAAFAEAMRRAHAASQPNLAFLLQQLLGMRRVWQAANGLKEAGLQEVQASLCQQHDPAAVHLASLGANHQPIGSTTATDDVDDGSYSDADGEEEGEEVMGAVSKAVSTIVFSSGSDYSSSSTASSSSSIVSGDCGSSGSASTRSNSSGSSSTRLANRASGGGEREAGQRATQESALGGAAAGEVWVALEPAAVAAVTAAGVVDEGAAGPVFGSVVDSMVGAEGAVGGDTFGAICFGNMGLSVVGVPTGAGCGSSSGRMDDVGSSGGSSNSTGTGSSRMGSDSRMGGRAGCAETPSGCSGGAVAAGAAASSLASTAFEEVRTHDSCAQEGTALGRRAAQDLGIGFGAVLERDSCNSNAPGGIGMFICNSSSSSSNNASMSSRSSTAAPGGALVPAGGSAAGAGHNPSPVMASIPFPVTKLTQGALAPAFQPAPTAPQQGQATCASPSTGAAQDQAGHQLPGAFRIAACWPDGPASTLRSTLLLANAPEQAATGPAARSAQRPPVLVAAAGAEGAKVTVLLAAKCSMQQPSSAGQCALAVCEEGALSAPGKVEDRQSLDEQCCAAWVGLQPIGGKEDAHLLSRLAHLLCLAP